MHYVIFQNSSWPGHATLEFFVNKNGKAAKFFNYIETGLLIFKIKII